jgi:hypothetical protein
MTSREKKNGKVGLVRLYLSLSPTWLLASRLFPRPLTPAHQSYILAIATRTPQALVLIVQLSTVANKEPSSGAHYDKRRIKKGGNLPVVGAQRLGGYSSRYDKKG